MRIHYMRASTSETAYLPILLTQQFEVFKRYMLTEYATHFI